MNDPKIKTISYRVGRYFFKKSIVNLLFIVIGAFLVAFIINDMQHKTAAIKQQQESFTILEEVVTTLSDNEKNASELTAIYHSGNQQTVADMKALLISGLFDNLGQMSAAERTIVLKDLVDRSGVSYLYIMDRTGRIVLAPFADFNGRQLTQMGFLTEENCKRLTEGTALSDGTILPAIETNSTGEYYFYSDKLDVAGDYYLILGADKKGLDVQLSSLTDISGILRHSMVASNGFLFAVSNDGSFLYYENEGEILTGKDASEYGLTDEIMEDGYSGIQTISGNEYLCCSKLCGDRMVVCAVAKTTEIFSNDRYVVFWSITGFVVVMLLCLAYARFVRTDFIRHKTETKRRPLFQFGHVQVLYDSTLGRRIMPLMAFGVLMIFCISFYTQTLLEISLAVESSQIAINEVGVRYEESRNNRSSVSEYYNNRFLAKAKLLSFLLEEDPSLLNEPSDRYYSHYTESGEKYYLNDTEGNRLRSIPFSGRLQQLCDENDLESIYLYDEMGRTIATNQDAWYFEISHDPQAQSYPFLNVLDGKADAYVQEVMEDEFGAVSQYIGVEFHYYTTIGETGDTRYVSRYDYEASQASGYEGPRITPHRSMLEIGLNTTLGSRIFANTDEKYIFSSDTLGDGFLVLFDKGEEHRVVYSRNESSIGKTAEELNFSPNMFEDEYYGFRKINGVDYLLYSVYAQDYYLATAIPKSSMFVARLPISLITSLISFIIILLQSLTISLTSAEEEILFQSAADEFRGWASSRTIRFRLPAGQYRNTTSASARWDNQPVSWFEKTPVQKLQSLAMVTFGLGIIYVSLALFFANRILSGNSVIMYILRGGWDRGTNIFAFTACAIVIIMVVVLLFLVRIPVRLLTSVMGAKSETIGHLLLSVAKYASALACLFYCLFLLGLDATNLIASAGILSLVIGLGAQSLIKDIIAGIFIVFEGEFRVGDIVTIANFRGTVMDIGLRTTKIVAQDGNLKILNNSEISGVLNMTQQISYAKTIIGIPFGFDLEYVETVMAEELPKIKERIPEIINGPTLKGVNEISASSVDLLFVAGCREEDIKGVTRALNREILLAFYRNNIEIPFNTMSIHQEK